MTDVARVEVVVPTFNRHERLWATLRSLQRQTLKGFAITVVDDGSNPPVQSLPESTYWSESGVRFRSTGGNLGPAAARNLAVRASAAELIAFLDDDVDAADDWLEAHLAHRTEFPDQSVSIGPLLAPPDWRPTPWNRWEAAKLAVEYERMARGVYAPTWRQLFTGNAVMRRQDFLAAGGFDEGFKRAEDIELGIRLEQIGCTFAFVPEARGWHYARRSRQAWLANAWSYAQADVEINRAHPEIGWLDIVADELTHHRPRSSRLARTLGGRLGRRAGVWGSLALSVLLNRGVLTPLSIRAVSVAYDLEYRHALRLLTEPLDRGGDSVSPGTIPEATRPG